MASPERENNEANQPLRWADDAPPTAGAGLPYPDRLDATGGCVFMALGMLGIATGVFCWATGTTAPSWIYVPLLIAILVALVTEASLDAENERVRLVALKVCSETGEIPNAAVTLELDGEEMQTNSEGGGPVDAAFKAIESVVKSCTELQLYSVNNITSGTDSQGEVTVRLEKGGRIVNGQGADTDIVIASAKAYINALNKILAPAERQHPQV